jgi:hypothetical protein
MLNSSENTRVRNCYAYFSHGWKACPRSLEYSASGFLLPFVLLFSHQAVHAYEPLPVKNIPVVINRISILYSSNVGAVGAESSGAIGQATVAARVVFFPLLTCENYILRFLRKSHFLPMPLLCISFKVTTR